MLKTNFLIISIIITIVLVLSIKSCNSNQTQTFCLEKDYLSYRENYMSKDGRIMDPRLDNITTSEGQSYMMFMSCVMKDKETFDLVYNWTKNNIRRSDGLFAWLWGKSKNGEYKILDDNSASDADVDIAFSLILAYEQWGDKEYLDDATRIIQAIWNKETRQIGKYRVLMPGVVQATSDEIEINPSYFSPYAFRMFQKYDKTNDWNQLIDSSYHYLNAITAKTKTGLAPDWFLIKNGQIVLETSKRGDFSYDAIRVFMRTYFDYSKTGDKRALPILEKSKFFIRKWQKDKTIYTNYKPDGETRDKNEFVGAIAILIPVINLYNPTVAKEIYETKLTPYFKDKGYWESKKDYYGKNLLWFGCYLYNGESLVNEK